MSDERRIKQTQLAELNEEIARKSEILEDMIEMKKKVEDQLEKNLSEDERFEIQRRIQAISCDIEELENIKEKSEDLECLEVLKRQLEYQLNTNQDERHELQRRSQAISYDIEDLKNMLNELRQQSDKISEELKL